MRHRFPLHALSLSISLAFAGQSAAADGIHVNQLGFLPGAAKIAVVPAGPAREFAIVDAATGAVVHQGALGAAAASAVSGDTVRQADFTSFAQPGRYRVRVAGLPDSVPFDVGPQVFAPLNAAAIKAYYFNRAGIPLEAKHAGVYARAAGHPDTHVLVHASAASPARPAGTVLSSPKGWYDAGDYNKYVVNSGITMYTLLAAYEDFPAQFDAQNLNIPESGNRLPDLLDEAKWNLEWMLTMQDSADGGVYHKLTNLRFDGMVMPADAKEARYVVQKSTAAALDFAAVTAMASRVYARFDAPLAARLLAASRAAWAWAQAHPAAYYRQPRDVVTGDYGDGDVSDEFAWAAAELFVTTGEEGFYKAVGAASLPATVPSWSDVRGLAWMSLARHREHLAAVADRTLIAARIDGLAASLATARKESAYGVPMRQGDFVWGSNAVALNQAMVLLHGYRLAGRREYLDAAQAGLDYVLGRNPVDTSYVTGFGARSPMHPHHRPSEADGIAAPVPGFIVGGPNPGQQDAKDCRRRYPSTLPALSYLDDVCSYASNEVAINWNAPLVYVTAGVQSLTK